VLRLDLPNLPELPAQAIDTLRGKRSAELDISQPAGRARLEQLLAEADVLVQGYRPGALDRYGLEPGALAERHPHLSVVTLSAWGTTGPWAARRGFDSLVQCPTGIALAEGADGKPGALPAQASCLVMPLLSSAMVLVSAAITNPHLANEVRICQLSPLRNDESYVYARAGLRACRSGVRGRRQEDVSIGQ